MKSVLVSDLTMVLETSEHSMGLETVSRVSWLPHQDEVLNENTQALLLKKPLGAKISRRKTWDFSGAVPYGSGAAE